MKCVTYRYIGRIFEIQANAFFYDFFRKWGVWK